MPETDTSTYNGKRWETLQSIHPNDRRGARATTSRWRSSPSSDGRGATTGFEYDIYKRYTDKRNDANRAAVRDLLLVGANHILSMVDAFATLRLQVQPEVDGRTRVGASLRW